MFYRKNVYAWEQIVRLMAGAAIIAGGFILTQGWLSYAIIATGLYTALTGVFGYCPACAMIGRGPVDKR